MGKYDTINIFYEREYDTINIFYERIRYDKYILWENTIL